MLGYVDTDWTPADIALLVRDGKGTGPGLPLQANEQILVPLIDSLAKLCKSGLGTFEMLWTFHAAHEFFDFLPVLSIHMA